ncbi:protein LURP-one-related 10-like [Iris pallida]|uniref:Protein LURP-one-related 10-like n=1 Tax=Iris pallida TaxID=29817 RepID=A0AAX6EHM0_IRIPA|nr:protein LURP-one-related 10-like [Iris pallida]
MAGPSNATAPPPPPPPPPPAVLAAPVAVLDPRYCVDYPVDMTITQKALSLTDGDYSIVDINGNVLFKVKGKVLSIHGQRALIDAAGNTVLTMRGKIRSMHDRWKIFRGVSTDQKDLLFSVKKSKFIQLKTQLNVYLATNTSETVPDFQVRGNRHERSCTIYLGESNSNVIIAQMREQYTFKNVISGRDMFGVTVYPKVDYAFIAALIIILDDIDHSEEA